MLAGPFLIVAVAIATTGPPVWSLKAILLFRVILFVWAVNYLFGGGSRIRGRCVVTRGRGETDIGPGGRQNRIFLNRYMF
jgi:hypothetical protein